MTIKQKLILLGLPIYWRSWRAKKLTKKIRNAPLDKPFSEQFKNDWILKKAKKLAKILKVKLKVEGWDNLPKAPALLTPNHSSNFDAALIMMALENPQAGEDYKNIKSVFLAKQELKNKKILKNFMSVINTFFIDRDNPRQALKEMSNFFIYAKKNKKMAVIFPSGTRNKKGEIGDFKAGAFKFAKKEFLPIVPVTINNSLEINDFSRNKQIEVKIIFGKSIKPMSFVTIDTKNIAKRVQAEVTKNWTSHKKLK